MDTINQGVRVLVMVNVFRYDKYGFHQINIITTDIIFNFLSKLLFFMYVLNRKQ